MWVLSRVNNVENTTTEKEANKLKKINTLKTRSTLLIDYNSVQLMKMGGCKNRNKK